MKITQATFYSTRELLARIKRVCMLHDRDTKPYEKAEVGLTDIHTDQLSPAQLYVLRPEFEKARALRWAFLEAHGVDILRLSDTKIRDGQISPADADRVESLGFIEYSTDQNPDQTITILPPIVEESVEADKTKCLIINDGMHRCYVARVSRIIPAVVKVAKLPPTLPYYAFPLVEGWAGVSMVEALSPLFLKKFHRFKEPDYKKYYRDFNSAFTNVGGPRGKGEVKKDDGKPVSGAPAGPVSK